MPNVDQFESVFRGATRAVFRYAPAGYERVLVVTDEVGEAAADFGRAVRGYLGAGVGKAAFEVVGGDGYDDVQTLSEAVDRSGADVVCTHRNLKGPGAMWPYSLGVYVDVLTQVARCAVLLLPSPVRGGAADDAVAGAPAAPRRRADAARADRDGDGDDGPPGGGRPAGQRGGGVDR